MFSESVRKGISEEGSREINRVSRNYTVFRIPPKWICRNWTTSIASLAFASHCVCFDSFRTNGENKGRYQFQRDSITSNRRISQHLA